MGMTTTTTPTETRCDDCGASIVDAPTSAAEVHECAPGTVVWTKPLPLDFGPFAVRDHLDRDR